MLITEIHGKQFEIDGKGDLSPALESTLEDWLHGMSIQDAAQKRHRSEETVKSHRKTLREQTHQKNGPGVLIYCLSAGYIRVLVFAGFAVTAEPIMQYSQSVQVIRTAPRFARAARKPMVVVSGGLH